MRSSPERRRTSLQAATALRLGTIACESSSTWSNDGRTLALGDTRWWLIPSVVQFHTWTFHLVLRDFFRSICGTHSGNENEIKWTISFEICQTFTSHVVCCVYSRRRKEWENGKRRKPELSFFVCREQEPNERYTRREENLINGIKFHLFFVFDILFEKISRISRVNRDIAVLFSSSVICAYFYPFLVLASNKKMKSKWIECFWLLWKFCRLEEEIFPFFPSFTCEIKAKMSQFTFFHFD